MKNAIIYCPHLNRDIRGLLNAVPNPQIWTGEPTERGEDGCLQCHQAIVRWAKHQQSTAVFVLEDDAKFTEHFAYGRWLEDAAWAEANGYDVLAGGCTRTYDERVVRDGLIEVSAFHSAHCVVYLQSSYETILRTVQPHDLSIGRLGARCLLAWPFVAVQTPAYSNILKQPVDYVPLYEAHEQRLGHALGLLEPPIAMPVY
jgi:hypothetical protein